MKKYIYKILFAFIFITLVSCEKVVKLDLHSVEPRLVIDASITDNMYCVVMLTETQDFDNNEPFKTVSDAIITLTDESGIKYPLAELSPGRYQSTVRGVTNQGYKLDVEVEGKTYTANTVIPERVEIDSIYIYNLQIGTESLYSPCIIYNDPKDVPNYYYSTVNINNRMLSTIYVRSDEFQNGVENVEDILFYNPEDNSDDDLKIGDVVRVNLQTIDEGAYRYFSTMITPGAGGAANPISNFSGNVLGCFKGYNMSTREITITEDHIFPKN